MKLNVILFSVLVFMIGCGDDEGPEPAPLGSECESDDQCEDGTCLVELPGNAFFPSLPFPEGYCTTGCEVAGDPCLDGEGLCVTHTVSGTQVCLGNCTENADCREGYSCYSFDEDRAVCVPEE